MNLKYNCIEFFADIEYGETFIVNSSSFNTCYIKAHTGCETANAINLISGEYTYFNPSLLVIPVTVKAILNQKINPADSAK